MRLFVSKRAALSLLFGVLLIVLFSFSGATARAEGPDNGHGKKNGHEQDQEQRKVKDDQRPKVKTVAAQSTQGRTVATQDYGAEVSSRPQNSEQQPASISQEQDQQNLREDYAQADVDVGSQPGIESEEQAEQGTDHTLAADVTTGANGARLLTMVKVDSGSRGVRSTVEAANADWMPLVPVMLILGSIAAAIALVASRLNPES